MDGSGTQIEPAAAVSDACGAELTGALDESVEQLAGRRVHVRGRPRRAEELACDASSSILACQQRRVLERNAPAGRGCGPGDEASPSGLERAVVGGGGRAADPGVDRGERGVARGL